MKDDDDGRGRIIPFPGRSSRTGHGSNGASRSGPSGPAPDDDEHDYAKPLLTFKKKEEVRRMLLLLPSWITPNGVTVFRALLIAPIAALLIAGRYWTALGIVAVAMLLDWVDGALAAARRQCTPEGAFLDPLADKVLICGSFLFLLGKLPWPFMPAVGAVCVIAVLLTVARLLKMAKARRQGLTQPSVAAKPAGKLKLVAETVSLLLAVLGLAIPWMPLIWSGFAFLSVALWYALGSLRGQLKS